MISHPLLAREWLRRDAAVDDGIVDVVIRPMPPQEADYVRAFLQQIDAVIGPAVRVVADEGKADIICYAVPQPYDDPSWRGATFSFDGVMHATWDASEMLYATLRQPPVYNRKGWLVRPGSEQRVLGPWAKRLINHEVLHAFGLSHPWNDAFAPGYDFSVTNMSSRADRDFSYAMTPLDREALQQLWS